MSVSWTASQESGCLVVHSATQLGPECESRVVVCGSHAGRYPAVLAVRARVRGIVFNDAGVGLRRAGVAGLEVLERAGIAAVAVDHRSARIGDAGDTLEHGELSEMNGVARGLGCEPGMQTRAAVALLSTASAPTLGGDPPSAGETRHLLERGPPAVWALDSAALVRPEDADSILMLGSHGGLVGGDPHAALRVDARAAVFNDAGGGRDSAGTARLRPLDERGIAAATVSAASAEIGDGVSTYRDGVLSATNETAASLGAVAGMPTPVFVARLGGTKRSA